MRDLGAEVTYAASAAAYLARALRVEKIVPLDPSNPDPNPNPNPTQAFCGVTRTTLIDG